MIVLFEGYSDDTVTVSRIRGGIYYNEEEHYVNGAYNAEFQLVTNHGEGLMVRAILEGNGVWSFSAYQMHGGQKFPDGWVVNIRNSPTCNYSSILQVDTSIDKVVVKRVYP